MLGLLFDNEFPHRLARGSGLLPLLLLLGAAMCGRSPAVAAESDAVAFPGAKSAWHGFDRFDFEVEGRPVLVVAPQVAAEGRPWVWHGEFFGHKPEPDIALLNRGFHIAYMRVPDLLGSPPAVAHWNAFYAELTGKYKLSRKPALVGLSRGGLYCYNWAAANPNQVACIYGDAPVCDFKSWPGGRGKGKGSPRDWQLVLQSYGFADDAAALAYDRNPVDNLAPLAHARVPLLHVYGDADEVVPWDENTGLIAERYRALGGEITLIAKPGVGHHPHGLDDSTPIVEFLARHGLAAAQERASAAARPRPNILVILADDLGRGDYSAFGTADIRTPHIDRLFREGQTWHNFYANCPVCSPTRAALLTGCYPDRVGVPGVIRDIPANSWGYLSPHATLLPQTLQQAGYHTAIVGKWHLGYEAPNTPLDRGFEFFHGFLGDMMDDYWTHLRNNQNFMRKNREVITPTGHATDLFSDWACDYLRQQAGAEQPFFLYLAYNAPHDPIQPPPEWLAKVRAREPRMSAKRSGLVALIEHLDDGIGRVLQVLDETGQADRTLVIFTSDNGGVVGYEANNGPWRDGKQHMYEGGLRVPCAIRWPGQIAAGSETDQIGITMDLFPTIQQAAGIAVSADIDGYGQLPTLLGETDALSRDLYFVRREGGPAYGGKTIEALRRGDWKLIQDSPHAPLELYHLGRDPQETRNVIDSERKVAAELSAALRRQIQRGGQVPWQAR